MQLDQKAIDFVKRAKEAGASFDQVASFLREKGYEFSVGPQQKQEQEQTQQPSEMAEQPNEMDPGLIQGSARAFSTEATGGLAPWIAGATNVGARMTGAAIGAIKDLDPRLLKQLDPRRIPEYYKEGKGEYETTQQAFGKEHPVAQFLSGGAGTLAGLGLLGGTVGAATKAKVASTALGKVPRFGAIAARTAGEAASFAAYEATKGAAEGGELSLGGAGKGAIQGGAIGLAFGVLGGGMQYAEPGLIQKAIEMGVNPTASNLLVKAFGLGVEGAAIGAIPAATELRAPTARELATGEVFALGGRGVAKAGEAAGKAAWRFANTPTKQQIAEAKPLADAIERAEGRVEEATAKEIDAARKVRDIESQIEQGADIEQLAGDLEKAKKELRHLSNVSKNEQQRLKDLQEITPIQEKAEALRNKIETLETKLETNRAIDDAVEKVSGIAKEAEGGRSASEIQEELNTLTREERIQDVGLSSELKPHFDNAQENVVSLMGELGFKPERRRPSSEKGTLYLDFVKDGNKKTVRVSGHKATKRDFDAEWDITKTPQENLRNIGNSLKEDEAAISKELPKLTKQLEGTEKVLPPELRDIKITTRLEPSEEEISSRMKEYSGNENMTPGQVRAIIIDEMKEGATKLKLDPSSKLSRMERFRRWSKALTSKAIQQFNWARPVGEAAIDAEAVTGKKVDAKDNPVEKINTSRGGGETEALLKPVVDKVQDVDKKYPGSAQGASVLLKAEKDVQFKRNRGEEPSKESLDIIEQFKNNKPVQEIANQVRGMNQKVLDKLYDVGFIDTATYNKLKANDKYVPSWAETLGDAGEQTTANEFGRFMRRYEGKAFAYKNPILTSLTQAKYLNQFAAMQKAKQQYISLAQKTGKVSLFDTIENYKGGPIKFDKAEQIVVWKDGKPQIWNVPKRVAEYFNPAPLTPDGKITKFIKAAAAMPLRFYKGGTTAASLGFAESNIPRDVTGAIIGSEYGGNISASSLASSSKELINGEPITVPFKKQFGNQTLRDIEQLPGVAEDNVRRFTDMYEAINSGTKEGTPANVMARMFTTSLPIAAKKAARVTSSTARKGLEMLSYAGNLSEETTRLSVFKSVLQGMAKNEAEYNMWLKNPDLIPNKALAEAGKEAREVTLNFRRQMAPWIETANKYFLPYFKPSILGAMRGFTVLTNPNIAPRAWRYIINLGIAQGLIKGNIVGGKQLEDLEAINNEISGKNLIIRGKDNRLLTIPLAQEIAPFVNIFSGVTEKMYRRATKQEREDIGRETIQGLKDLVENYAPIYGYAKQPSNFAFGGPIPKTILEESVNMNFFTRTPIEPASQKNRPAYMRQTKNTPALAIQLSKTLAKNGIEISPLRLRHITTGLTSNVGKELFAATDSVLSQFGAGPLRAKKELTDSPYTRRFIADVMAPYSQYAQDANDIIEKAKQGNRAMEFGDPNDWSEKQARTYQEQADIYEMIKDDMKDLQSIYSDRAELESDFAEEARALQMRLKNKEISKEDFKKKWRELEYQLKEFTEQQALEERAYQLNIINAAKQVKETYKKAPR